MKIEKFLELTQSEQVAALASMSAEKKQALKDELRLLARKGIGQTKKALYEQQNDVLVRTNRNLASASQHIEQTKEILDRLLNKGD